MSHLDKNSHFLTLIYLLKIFFQLQIHHEEEPKNFEFVLLGSFGAFLQQNYIICLILSGKDVFRIFNHQLHRRIWRFFRLTCAVFECTLIFLILSGKDVKIRLLLPKDDWRFSVVTSITKELNFYVFPLVFYQFTLKILLLLCDIFFFRCSRICCLFR